ncbi:hypothetical protein QYE76_049198 [Lolium multiflorum]|uniref:RNase H type-1 domain-containing protein n=1 Tax=Lolium multiflorum TaxID=4521 RepID=A0AAD8SNS0_LOLMU|nr:hypothetical protein QYE76_049198 [Lolium multiflorum]
MVAQAGMDAVYRSDILNKPITPEDVEALEAKRVELLATAKKFKNTAAAMLEERKHAAVFVEDFIQREQEVDEGLAKVKELRKHWEDKIVEAHQEVEKVRRELIVPRKITFATPTEQQPLATPKDNMTKAAEILKKNNEEIDIDYVRTLVASAVKQQSKADTSRKLESNTEHCVSTAQKDARDNRHQDDESRTGSSERRRKAREHPNPIPVPSKTPPSDPRKGKDAMYSGRDKYRNASPPPNGYPRPPRRRSPAGNTRPQGHGGIVIRDNVLPSRNKQGAHANLAGIGTTIVSPSLGGAGMRSATRSPVGAGTTKAASVTAKAATGAGASTGKAGENLKTEARGRIGPRRPTYHKFHARACYIYNKLKIPGPNGKTYQRTMQRCLKDQIGRNVHAYVDDIAVMTRKGSDLISDLTETFDNLRRLDKLRMQVWSRNQTWVMHFDGSKQQGSGAGVTLKSPTGEELQYLQIHFEATNNMAEYEALLHGLRIAKEIGITAYACGDSDWWHNK